MTSLIQSEEAFTRFIEEYRYESEEVKYEQAISEMAVRGIKSLVIDFTDLYAFDEDLARVILDKPVDHLPQRRQDHHHRHRRRRELQWDRGLAACHRVTGMTQSDPANLDYRLMPTSPCIGKASDGGDIGCRFTPEMIEMWQNALELRAKGIIKF